MKPKHGTWHRYSSKKYLCRCDRCRAAATKYQRDRRASRPDVRKANNEYSKRRYYEIRAYMDERKKAPCVDCGVIYPPYVMQFDHLPGSEKKFTISQVFKSIELIDEEIAKCELVCANCHAERTHNRRGLTKP